MFGTDKIPKDGVLFQAQLVDTFAAVELLAQVAQMSFEWHGSSGSCSSRNHRFAKSSEMLVQKMLGSPMT